MAQLLWQLQGQAGEGNLDEIFQRLAAHLPPKASASAVDDSPQAKLNEEMYQAVRDGDITHFQACMARGTFLHLTTPLPGLLEGHIQIQFCFSLYYEAFLPKCRGKTMLQQQKKRCFQRVRYFRDTNLFLHFSWFITMPSTQSFLFVSLYQIGDFKKTKKTLQVPT